jgi:hypothetical protein
MIAMWWAIAVTLLFAGAGIVSFVALFYALWLIILMCAVTVIYGLRCTYFWFKERDNDKDAKR